MATATFRTEQAAFAGEVFANFRQAHGRRGIARELNARGHAYRLGLLADLMRKLSLQSVQPREPSGSACVP
jgi:hypothetical protein